MNLSDEQILEIHELLDRLVENNLSSDQKKRLEKVLEESDDARKIYVSFMDMHAAFVTTLRKACLTLIRKREITGEAKLLNYFCP